MTIDSHHSTNKQPIILAKGYASERVGVLSTTRDALVQRPTRYPRVLGHLMGISANRNASKEIASVV